MSFVSPDPKPGVISLDATFLLRKNRIFPELWKWIKMILLVIAFVVMGWSPAFGNSGSIRIGATVSATGHFSTEVGPFRRLFRAWAAEVNQTGGIYLKGKGKSGYAVYSTSPYML